MSSEPPRTCGLSAARQIRLQRERLRERGLAGPGLAHDREHLALRQLEADAVDRDRAQHRVAGAVVDREVARGDRREVGHRRHSFWPSSSPRRARSVSRRCACSIGSGTGSEASRRWVYGCCGAPSTCAAGPCSTSSPWLSTAMRSASRSTTARSWLMNSAAKPNSRCSSANSSSTRACTDTSSALVGSSAISRVGSSASDRARLARWRCPPRELVREPVAERLRAAAPPRAARRRAACALRRVAGPAVHDERLGDALGDRQQRVEARGRVLEHEPDLLAHRPERPAP